MAQVAEQVAGASTVAHGSRDVGLWSPVASLWRRELVRFFRQRNRVIGAIGTPLMFWLVLGLGLNDAFTMSDSSPDVSPDAAAQVGYLAYFYPGTVVLVLLFTAIFSTISVIEDRREGFLQGVLASPASRLSIVLGKVLGGASIATAQGALLLLLWPLVSPWPGALSLLAAVLVMFVMAIGLTGMGLAIAWPMDSTAGFHAVMNLLLMPMWFLSGSVFPIDTAPLPMRILMWINPMTWGHAALSAAMSGRLLGGPETGWGGVTASPWLDIAVMAAMTAGFTLLATWVAQRPRKDGLA